MRSEFVAPELRHAILVMALAGGLVVKLWSSFVNDTVMAAMSRVRRRKRVICLVLAAFGGGVL